MSFFNVLRGEAKLIFSDIAIVLTIIGGVVLYSFLYPQPYGKQSVSSLHVSVVDLDRSDVSRQIIYELNATPQVDVVRVDVSKRDALEALEKKELKAVVIIPAHFKRDLALLKSPTIALGVDSSYFLIYGAVLEGAMKSVMTYSTKIKVVNLLKSQVPISKAKTSSSAYSLKTINLFNKENSYTQYVVPAVFILILQQTLLIGLGILGGGVNEGLRDKKYLHYGSAKTWYVILSRYLIFGLIFFVHMLFYFGFSYKVFEITHLALRSELLAFGVIFLLAVMALGTFLGSLFRSREIATPIVLFSSLPLVFSVGFIWPLEAIPSFIHYLSYISPSTPAIMGFLKLNQMGASLSMVVDEIFILLIQAIFYTIFGYYIINTNKQKFVKNQQQ
ncbi:ABC transporter permease [Sulfurimonas sp. SAG-AH-194-L11]|nr:ABC transporter permease [Sulfurimonas sp. SAG-AH-194-L11]MDF1876357.1 ABC transporter permease [Sulfurimonas sp. SAG-AH-194-L11]